MEWKQRASMNMLSWEWTDEGEFFINLYFLITLSSLISVPHIRIPVDSVRFHKPVIQHTGMGSFVSKYDSQLHKQIDICNQIELIHEMCQYPALVEEHDHFHRCHLLTFKKKKQCTSLSPSHMFSPSAFIHAWAQQGHIYMLPETPPLRHSSAPEDISAELSSSGEKPNKCSSFSTGKTSVLRMPESMQQAVNRCPLHCPRPTPNIPPCSESIINVGLMCFN